MVYAGFWKRFLALLVDSIVFLILFIPLMIVLGPDTVNDETGGVGAGINALLIVAMWIYYAAMESSANQGTLGKMALGIRVTDLQGNKITFGKATGRHFAKYISAIILMVGYFMAAFTEKKQGLHDMLAGALVLKK